MIPAVLIKKKRDGEELSPEEIKKFIQGLFDGSVENYQASAFLMATFFQGMSHQETVALTQAMVESGKTMKFPKSLKGAKVDKHSTGGVGDKVSIILAPLASACGLVVPMMAGRGLGHSGGTVDKLEAIPGYETSLSDEKFIQVLQKVGCSIIGQSDQIAPADKKLYALRDVTATIECVPLIVGSILSKKIAEGAEGLVLDLKVGSGAFMKTLKDAKLLGNTITRVGKKLGLQVRVVLSGMSQPLGYASGNAIEIIESIEVLQGRSRNGFSSLDLRELTIHLCAQMLMAGKMVKSLTEGRKLSQQKLQDGSAMKKFEEMVEAHGGNLKSYLDSPESLLSHHVIEVPSPKKGFISSMDTEKLGWLLVEMGAGRKQSSDKIDPSVGIAFHKKTGNKISQGENLATLYCKKGVSEKSMMDQFLECIELSPTRKQAPKLILGDLK